MFSLDKKPRLQKIWKSFIHLLHYTINSVFCHILFTTTLGYGVLSTPPLVYIETVTAPMAAQFTVMLTP